MSNADLIERLRNAATFGTCLEAADALAAADKWIAELEAKIDEAYKKGYATGEEEAEHKLTVAREALRDIRNYATSEAYMSVIDAAGTAIVQIGGEDGN